jgi:phosphoserine phosphatase
VLAGDMAALAKLGLSGLLPIVAATHSGMSVDAFSATVRDWMGTAKHPRWKRPYADLVYLPMLEVMRYLRANGYQTHFVTGGGQVFVRTYADRVYGIPPAQVIGSAMETQFTVGEDGRAVLMKTPKLVLNNDLSGKPEDIYLFLGGPPQAAFGNSNGDQPMLEYTQAGGGARLMMLVLHDDAAREYAYGPAAGLPDTKFGAFDQGLYDKAKAESWSVISMKNDWNRLFAFEASHAV